MEMSNQEEEDIIKWIRKRQKGNMKKSKGYGFFSIGAQRKTLPMRQIALNGSQILWLRISKINKRRISLKGYPPIREMAHLMANIYIGL
jgi:hypothetical protein